AAPSGCFIKRRVSRSHIKSFDRSHTVDPGRLIPYRRGGVLVTADGAETDLDLGHYERFIDENLTRACNITAGQIYSEVIGQERRGDFLGGTNQEIPHITNENKRRVQTGAKKNETDVEVVEICGTVGDIGGRPFLLGTGQR